MSHEVLTDINPFFRTRFLAKKMSHSTEHRSHQYMWRIPDKVHMTTSRALCRDVIRMQTVCVASIWTQEANADIGQRATHTWCAALLLRPREALSVILHTHRLGYSMDTNTVLQRLFVGPVWSSNAMPAAATDAGRTDIRWLFRWGNGRGVTILSSQKFNCHETPATGRLWPENGPKHQRRIRIIFTVHNTSLNIAHRFLFVTDELSFMWSRSDNWNVGTVHTKQKIG